MRGTVRDILLVLERAIIGDLDQPLPLWGRHLETTEEMLKTAATRAHQLLAVYPSTSPPAGQYRRKAVEVAATPFDPMVGDLPPGVMGWRSLEGESRRARDDRHGTEWTLETPVGAVPLRPGDWIVTEHGKSWPCPAETFSESYEQNPEAGLQTRVNNAMERLRSAATAPALGRSLETEVPGVISELTNV